MTDRPFQIEQTQTDAGAARLDRTTAGPSAGEPQVKSRRRAATGSRIAATGIGVAAMIALVSAMEVDAGSVSAAGHQTTSQHDAAVAARSERAQDLLAAAAVPRPIVLTPHAVVHTVNVPAPSGGSSYAAVAPPAPAVPVATTGGSRP
jgi:hypothetical protein